MDYHFDYLLAPKTDTMIILITYNLSNTLSQISYFLHIKSHYIEM